MENTLRGCHNSCTKIILVFYFRFPGLASALVLVRSRWKAAKQEWPWLAAQCQPVAGCRGQAEAPRPLNMTNVHGAASSGPPKLIRNSKRDTEKPLAHKVVQCITY